MSADFDSLENLGYKIYRIRGLHVILDSDVAKLFLTETRKLNQQIKRNLNNLPEDSVFRLTKEEYKDLKNTISQLVTSRIQKVTYRYGGRIRPPYVFTEVGLKSIHVFLRKFVTKEKFLN